MQKVKDFIIKNKYYIVYMLAGIFVAYFTVKQKIFQVKAAVDINVQLDSISTIDGLYTQPSIDTLTDTLKHED